MDILHKRSFHKILIFEQPQSRLLISPGQLGKVLRLLQILQCSPGCLHLYGERIRHLLLPGVRHKIKGPRNHILLGQVHTVDLECDAIADASKCVIDNADTKIGRVDQAFNKAAILICYGNYLSGHFSGMNRVRQFCRGDNQP